MRALLEVHPRIRVVGEAATGREALSVADAMRPQVVLLDLRLPDLDGLEVCRQLKATEPPPAALFLTSFADDRTELSRNDADGSGSAPASGAVAGASLATFPSQGSSNRRVQLRGQRPTGEGAGWHTRGRACSSSPIASFRLRAVEAGANGVLLKRMAGLDIPGLILTVAGGGSVLDPRLTRRVLESARQPDLARSARATSPGLGSLGPQEGRVLESVAMGQSNKHIAAQLQLSEGRVRNYLSAVFSKLGVESRVQAATLWLRHQIPPAAPLTGPNSGRAQDFVGGAAKRPDTGEGGVRDA